MASAAPILKPTEDLSPEIVDAVTGGECLPEHLKHSRIDKRKVGRS